MSRDKKSPRFLEIFVPRDPAFARVFSGRSAILKIVEEKALGTRLESFTVRVCINVLQDPSKYTPLQCSPVLCCLLFVASTSWILESLESSLSAKPSRIHFSPLLRYLNAIGCITLEVVYNFGQNGGFVCSSW